MTQEERFYALRSEMDKAFASGDFIEAERLAHEYLKMVELELWECHSSCKSLSW